MKLNLFLAAMFAGLSGYCQPDKTHDSLRKYSYLVFSALYVKDSTGKVVSYTPREIGTGFIVEKNGKLFLGSAYHGLTATDAHTKRDTSKKQTDVDTPRIDVFLLRYYDLNDDIKYDTISLNDIKDLHKRIYFLKDPDVLFVELKGKFKYIGKVFTMNNFIYAKEKPVPKKANQKIISFGYPGWMRYRYGDSGLIHTPAKLYEGYLADSFHYDRGYDSLNIDSMYITTTPNCHSGASGSPVFKIVRSGKRKWIEFIGMQSGKKYRL